LRLSKRSILRAVPDDRNLFADVLKRNQSKQASEPEIINAAFERSGSGTKVEVDVVAFGAPRGG